MCLLHLCVVGSEWELARQLNEELEIADNKNARLFEQLQNYSLDTSAVAQQQQQQQEQQLKKQIDPEYLTSDDETTSKIQVGNMLGLYLILLLIFNLFLTFGFPDKWLRVFCFSSCEIVTRLASILYYNDRLTKTGVKTIRPTKAHFKVL